MSERVFPLLDADRAHESEIGRVVIDTGEPIEPHVTEMDAWVTIPIRVAHNAAAGVVLEVGPYTLDADDVRALRNGIERFYAAGGAA